MQATRRAQDPDEPHFVRCSARFAQTAMPATNNPNEKNGIRIVNQWLYGLLIEWARHVYWDMLSAVHFTGDLKPGG
jgi:hypothetical protein